ncbi:hypothetical protein ACWWD9_07145 [Methylovorus sp. SPW-M1]
MHLFRQFTWGIRKYFLPTFLILIIFSMTYVAYDYFIQPHKLWGDNWASCGNYDKFSNPQSNTLALEIKNKELDAFSITGELSLTPKAYEALTRKKAIFFITLEPLRSPSSGMLIPQFIELDITNVTLSWNNKKIIKVKEAEFYPWGTMVYFPFDEYRIGFIPRLNVASSKDEVAKEFPLDAVVSKITLTKVMSVSKAKTWNDYVQNDSLQDNKGTKYEEDECAVIAKRSGWYKCLIALLLLLLVTPAIYLIYRPEDNPGIDLIAVILGVATIRQFFLGSLLDWQLSWIDILFAGITVLTAIIPLVHIVKTQLKK